MNMSSSPPPFLSSQQHEPRLGRYKRISRGVSMETTQPRRSNGQFDLCRLVRSSPSLPIYSRPAVVAATASGCGPRRLIDYYIYKVVGICVWQGCTLCCFLSVCEYPIVVIVVCVCVCVSINVDFISFVFVCLSTCPSACLQIIIMVMWLFGCVFPCRVYEG